MALWGSLDLVPNVIESSEMILQLHYGGLRFSEQPESAANRAIKRTPGCQPRQREFEQGTFFEGARTQEHARSDLPLQLEIEGGTERHFACGHQRKISRVALPGGFRR